MVSDKDNKATLKEILNKLGASPNGLSDPEAQERLETYGPNELRQKKKQSKAGLFLNQFRSPIILILIFASLLSAYLKEYVDAGIILLIIFASGILSFYQESSASDAVQKLLEKVRTRVNVIREGKEEEVLIDDIVPGDVIFLSAGDLIPADCVLLEAKDFFVNEALLTGETFPVEKTAPPPDALLDRKTNWIFMGTNAESGTARALAVVTGRHTEMGKIAGKLALKPPETDFERGVRRFGFLLMEVTFILLLIVFAVNVYFNRPVIDSLLFSLALAVGLTPQLLPAIISINLSKGSQAMSKKGVIVKKLASIENFGTMDVLCTDKTGTLTKGTIYLENYFDIDSRKDDKVLLYAYLNARFQTGLKNPLDQAILNSCKEKDFGNWEKVDEIPYDFMRKRLSVVLKGDGKRLLISKGALNSILKVCTKAESGGEVKDISPLEDRIKKSYLEWSEEGLRILGLAFKEVPEKSAYGKDDESDMVLLGFLLFLDPPKEDVGTTIRELNELGIDVKIITGDNRYIAAHIAKEVNFRVKGVLCGEELENVHDPATFSLVQKNNIFAEMNPSQKERIIVALKKTGNVVGFLGDGINDVTAIHAADVGISVDTAADVAKESAEIVLLEKSLETLKVGVTEGRKTFSNTLKYVFMATSANFGNMFSVAGASLLIPFLPMLPKQILLLNFLQDIPEISIATDNIDPELVEKPRRWDISFIKKFMIFFGLISSFFDFATFGVLLWLLRANPAHFRTGWFVESATSAILVILVIRTRRPFFKSKPGKYLLRAIILVALFAMVLPYLPHAGLLGFRPLPPVFFVALFCILFLYIIFAEIGKRIFYRRQ